MASILDRIPEQPEMEPVSAPTEVADTQIPKSSHQKFIEGLKDELRKDEGKSLTSYEDPPGSGNYSIGYGHHLGPSGKGKTITEAQAEAYLDADTKKHAKRARDVTGESYDRLSPKLRKEIAKETYRGLWAMSPKTRGLLAAGKYEEAAEEYMKAKDIDKGGSVVSRMKRLADAMRQEGQPVPEPSAQPMPEATEPAFINPPSQELIEKSARPEVTETPKEPVADAHEKQVARMATKRIGTVDNIEKRASKVQSMLDNLEKQSSQLGTTDRDEFLKAKKEFMDIFNARKDRIEQAEVIEAVGKGLATMLAGWYGLKHGVNMGNMQFDKVDWSQKHAQNMAELRQALNMKQEEIGLGRSERREKIGLQTQQANLELQKLNLNMQKLRELQRIRDKTDIQAAKQAALERANRQELRAIAKTLQDKTVSILEGKYDDDTKKAALAGVLQTELGIPAEAAKSIFVEPGALWGENIKDTEKVVSDLSLLSQKMTMVPPGYTPVLMPDGSIKMEHNSRIDYHTKDYIPLTGRR